MQNRTRTVLVSTAVLLCCAAAQAQLTPTAQVRRISGESFSTTSGFTFGSGLLETEVPPGDFSTWDGFLNVSGFISGNNTQLGGFNGTDTITLQSFTMNLGGGNGPDTAADSVATNTFSYTFDVASEVNYTISADVGCAGPFGAPNTTVDFSVSVSLTGSEGDVFRYTTGFDNGFHIMVQNVTGAIVAGTYTLSVVGQGHVAFIAPPDSGGNGAGGGAGGPQPIMTFTVSGAGCAADFNGDGERNPDDLADFITCFFLDVQFPGICPDADFNDDTFRDPDDLADFITTFFLGC